MAMNLLEALMLPAHNPRPKFKQSKPTTGMGANTLSFPEDEMQVSNMPSEEFVAGGSEKPYSSPGALKALQDAFGVGPPQDFPPDVQLGTPTINAGAADESDPPLVDIPKKSSTARASKTGAGKSMDFSGSPITLDVGKPAADPAAPVKDQITEMLLNKQASAEVDQDSAKAKAVAAKDLTDGEKIFTALMAVLPGLVGTIGGGAIAGGAGAAAGAAGGLGGGANAIGAMMGEKEQLRQEALGEAAAAQGRVDQAGNQLLGHEEKLQGQQFQVGERQAGQEFAASRQEDSQAYGAEQDAKQRSFMRGQMISGQRHEERMLDKKYGYDIEAAAAAARAKGPGEVKDFQQKSAEAAGDMIIAADDITKFTSGIKDSGMQSLISNSSFADIVKNPATQQFAVAVARFMNAHLHHTTGASISEEEWKQAKAMFVPSFSDDEKTRKMKERYRIDAATAAYEGAGPAQVSVQRRLQAYDRTAPGASTESPGQAASALPQYKTPIQWDN